MSIVDWIYPKICVGCKKEGDYICLNCQKKLVKPIQICPMCSDPSLDGYTHARCASRYGIDRLVVGLSYRGLVQDCLKKVKYKNSFDIISFLYKLCEFPNLASDRIVPVPMWRNKERERGFNQAEILAKLVEGRVVNLLTRVRETRPMFGLKRIERRENVYGAFGIRSVFSSKTKVSDIKHVLLVDDVWTTGSTMRECALVLKRFGIKRITALTLAR